MKIVVQNPRTGRYLEETGGWTNDVRLARDFVSSADAINARRQYQLAAASLVFRFEREGYCITVPMESLPCETSEVPFRPEGAKSQEIGLLIG